MEKQSLWDRLKPEFKESIIRFWGEKPKSLQNIQDELSCNYWYNDLSYGTIKDVYWACYETFSDVSELKLMQMFND